MVNSHAYEVDGQPIEAEEFIRLACSQHHSVVVEACAGSGKTWLLVSRMLHLLLSGVKPSELLAITFTRKAAQEMQQRLFALLEELALSDVSQVRSALVARGIYFPSEKNIEDAQGLYEKVLLASSSLTVDTFHSWFARLISMAPLAAGIPQGLTLLENVETLQSEAYRQLMYQLREKTHEQLKDAFLFLCKKLGNAQTKKWLDAFLDKRAEWWLCQKDESGTHPLDWLKALCGKDVIEDARLHLWDDTKWINIIRRIAYFLGQGTPVNQKRAVLIESIMSQEASIENFSLLWGAFIDKNDQTRSNHKTKPLCEAIEKEWGSQGIIQFDQSFEEVADYLRELKSRSDDKMVFLMNEALFTLGQAYLTIYQGLKNQQRVLDFADLEWYAYSLLSSPLHAAYMHTRLDARYKHILLDEFQDTNLLQWHILTAWLSAYSEIDPQPTLFIVGDPKQSIYRFRRANPRIFFVVSDMLAKRGAFLLRTNQTRRNARTITNVLNMCMQKNPLFHTQTTLSKHVGGVWRLPLIKKNKIEKKEDEESSEKIVALRNPLTTPQKEDEEDSHIEEALYMVRALFNLRKKILANGEAFRWSDVLLLVRRRTHLAAYEKVFRHAGIPFISGRRGGLFKAIEMMDMMALLRFLITPVNNLALAHILKSPIFSATDDDLIFLAQDTPTSWWEKLTLLSTSSPVISPALKRAAHLLKNWLVQSSSLSVHDLLDYMFAQGEFIVRYAQHTPYALREQVLENLNGFIGLALDMDGGRYPSLTKFIEELAYYEQYAHDDSPDEAPVDHNTDALRILTIHSAKGLEARVVLIADSHHTTTALDTLGILFDWPLEDDTSSKHFSAFTYVNENGRARQHLFLKEKQLAEQENWNLLYVALTRAQEYVIISGVASMKNKAISWYDLLEPIVPEMMCTDNDTLEQSTHDTAPFLLQTYTPPDLASSIPPSEEMDAINEEEKREGILLHRLLECLTREGTSWPILLPTVSEIAAWLVCSRPLAEKILNQVHHILHNKELECFFNPAYFLWAKNELTIVLSDKTYRLDRVVMCDDTIWILDYKKLWHESNSETYQAQLLGYAEALQQIYDAYKIRTAIISAKGEIFLFDLNTQSQ